MWKQNGAAVVLVSILLIVLYFSMERKMKINERELNVWMRFKPQSTDPLNYDLDVHHMTMRSVYASLVSLYGVGKVTPQIGKSWENSEDKREWIVTLDPAWKFSNGDSVTPEIVLKNFKRVLKLKKDSGSRSGLLEFLVGFNDFNSMKDEIPGLRIVGNKIIFSFVKPMPNFLEKISFGLYGIAHPSQYNSESGEWIDHKKAISSGNYVVDKWSDNNFELKLRTDMAKSSNAINKIVFFFSKDPEEILKADILFREKFNYLVDLKDWSFMSTLEDSNIVYVKVMKWKDTKSIFSNVEMRRQLRGLFYRSLEEAGFSAVKSFFPTSIQ